MIIWLKNSPKFDKNLTNFDEITNYIDKFITCTDTFVDESCVHLQKHEHRSACKNFQKVRKNVGLIYLNQS